MSIQDRLGALNEDYNTLSASLYEDLTAIIQQIKIKDSQTWRRLYIKSLTSAIEAQLSYIHSHIKVIKEFDHLPLDEKEESIVKGKKLPFEHKTIFMLNLFSEANYTSLKINTKSEKWGNFVTLIRIRNRITHPKTSKDIFITLEEIKICENAFNDFQTTLEVLMQKAGETLMEEANRLREILNNVSK